MREIWSEKYRPTNMDEYVFKDDAQRKQMQNWIDSGALSHCIMAGPPGTGKTSAALMILSELGVEECDILYINASLNNGIEYIRSQVVGFAESMPFGEFKYVIMDECDYISFNGFAALRGVMQDFADTTRFILTCNYVNKVPEAIVSRCQMMTIDKLTKVEFTTRVAKILLAEEVQFELEVLDEFIDRTYPDMRKCINSLQFNVSGGTLNPPSDEIDSNEYIYMEMAKLFKAGKIKEARKYICANIPVDQFVDVYRFLYRNIELFASDESKEDECLLIIRKGLVEHGNIADPEICLSATIAQLGMV